MRFCQRLRLKRRGLLEAQLAFMNGAEIRQLNAEDAAEYQAVFLRAVQSAPSAFAADYGEEPNGHRPAADVRRLK